jgi:hypothetical protein
MQQLLAKNCEAKEEHANRQQQMSTAEQMRQTTMTQCFGSSSAERPPPAPDPPPAEGYTHVTVDGQQYLVNETTQAIMRVPPKNVSVSEKARSMSPLNLARESFEVTPSVRKVPSSKRRTATAQASNNFVLSENIGSGSEDEIVYVQQLRKKIRKPAPSPPESSQEVQVIEQVEVESQDLPKTCNFAEFGGNSRATAQELESDAGSETDVDAVDNDSARSTSDKSVNLLEEDSA